MCKALWGPVICKAVSGGNYDIIEHGLCLDLTESAVQLEGAFLQHSEAAPDGALQPDHVPRKIKRSGCL